MILWCFWKQLEGRTSLPDEWRVHEQGKFNTRSTLSASLQKLWDSAGESNQGENKRKQTAHFTTTNHYPEEIMQQSPKKIKVIRKLRAIWDQTFPKCSTELTNFDALPHFFIWSSVQRIRIPKKIAKCRSLMHDFWDPHVSDVCPLVTGDKWTKSWVPPPPSTVLSVQPLEQSSTWAECNLQSLQRTEPVQ
jgi:hypothetical protein